MPVCHKGTLRVSISFRRRGFSGRDGGIRPGGAAWRKVGSASVDLRLAGPATGPVEQVWFAPGGGVLYARAASGAVFETADYETWTPVTAGRSASRPPSHGRTPTGSLRANSHFVFQSESNLRFRQAALSLRGWRPRLAEPDRVRLPVGDWRWREQCNGFARGCRSISGGKRFWRVAFARWRAFLVGAEPGAAESPGPPDPFDGHRNVGDDCRGGEPGHARVAAQRLAMATGGRKPARCLAGRVVFEPAANRNHGRGPGRQHGLRRVGRRPHLGFGGWRPQLPCPALAGRRRPIERIFADSAEPRVALAALAGNGPHVLRTTNAGGFWDASISTCPTGLRIRSRPTARRERFTWPPMRACFTAWRTWRTRAPVR